MLSGRPTERPMADEFEEPYTSAFGRLVGQLFLITGDLHEAEEVVQEAFTRAASRWQRLRDYDLPEQWIRRVAINLARDGRRRVRRRLAILTKLDADAAAVVPPISVDGLVVAAALATLPRRHRQVVVLHYLLDLPVQEVARQLAVPVGTVKSRLARARTALAAQLDTETDRVRSGHG
jgi:RNA polymerase sigma-70 factor, ECF subfamily